MIGYIMYQNGIGGNVVFDNETIDKSYYERDNDKESYQISDEVFSERIRDLSVSELIGSNNFKKEILIDAGGKDINKLLKLKDTKTYIEGTPISISDSTILFTGRVDYEEWDKSYTLREFIDLLKLIIDSDNKINMTIYYGDDYSTNENDGAIDTLDFSIQIESVEQTIREEEERIFCLLSQYYDEVEKTIFDKGSSLFFEFSIPKEFKIPCKQYLEYFVQFLADIGMDTHANLYEEVNKLLFEIIPDNKQVVLKNIADCLMLYLNLTDNKEIDEYDDYHNIAYMQLKSNICHLKSQLMLAHATIEQKQITIELMKNEIKRIESDVKRDSKDFEFLNGVVTVGGLDCKVFKINLGQLLKLLTRKS